jgi:uncharacterized YccA/Bax inhibitor family protein
MRSNNPVLSRSDAFKSGGYATFGSASGAATQTARTQGPSLEDLYAAPSASPVQTGRMTYDDVVVRTGGLLAVVVAAAAVAWVLLPVSLALPFALVGLVLGLVNSFKREPSPALILAYGAAQGVFLGAISKLFEGFYDGIVFQAVLATVATFAVMLGLYKSRVIRVTPKFTKIMLGAILGYAVFCLINLVLNLTGVADVRSGFLGLLIGAVGAVLAALSLALDFDFVERGVQNGIPQRYAWTAAFGLVLTLIWLYVEMLRILAILRGDD